MRAAGHSGWAEQVIAIMKTSEGLASDTKLLYEIMLLKSQFFQVCTYKTALIYSYEYALPEEKPMKWALYDVGKLANL